MKQDFNRFTRLLVQGRFRQIISSNRTDTPNNYQKIVKLSISPKQGTDDAADVKQKCKCGPL